MTRTAGSPSPNAGSAGRLYDDVSDRFGRDLVFRDLDAIQPGAVYGEIINDAIAKFDVVVVVMGNQWIDAGRSNGRRRLENPDELVRTEDACLLGRTRSSLPC